MLHGQEKTQIIKRQAYIKATNCAISSRGQCIYCKTTAADRLMYRQRHELTQK